MEQDCGNQQVGNVQEVAIGLLQQSERCASGGFFEQAELLLMQVWAITDRCHPELANLAAWHMAWLGLSRAHYDEAMRWLACVEVPQAWQCHLWQHARQTLLPSVQAHSPWDGSPSPAPSPPRIPRPFAASTVRPANLPRLEVQNLGRFHIIRAGRTLPPCKAHKALALFRYLLTQPNHSAHKEELMELFWPNVQVQQATNNLHVTMGALRRYLDPAEGSYLLFDDGHYLINPDAVVEEDCRQFQNLRSQAEVYWQAGDIRRAEEACTTALTWYRGDYYLEDREFAWAGAERERLLAVYLAVLEQLGKIYMRQQRFESVLDPYQRLTERDGYREDIQYQLIYCYAQLGRRGDAIRQYQRCATLLARDLGIEPMPELQALYHTIMLASNEATIAGRPASIPAPVPSPSAVL